MNSGSDTEMPADDRERIFYDGHCGLCHHAVRFLLDRDPEGTRFRFAPLGGETFSRVIPAERQKTLPDSLVLQRRDGSLLLRSNAALHALGRLPRPWPFFASLLRWLPLFLRDRLYDLVARWRGRLFARPDNTCPLLPPPLRRRFDP